MVGFWCGADVIEAFEVVPTLARVGRTDDAASYGLALGLMGEQLRAGRKSCPHRWNQTETNTFSLSESQIELIGL